MKTWMSTAHAAIVGSMITLSSAFLTGCGKSDSGGSPTTTPPATTETSSRGAAAPPVRAGAARLVGTWLGVAYLEEDKVAAKMARVTDDNLRLSLNTQVDTFQSMVVGAEFTAAGSFTLEAELTPAGGQTARDTSTGAWKIKTEAGDVIVVESQEPKTDGLFDISEKEYTFIDDDHFVWIPAVSQDLRDCDAMIVFERQTPSSDVGTGVAEVPGTAVPR